MSNYHVNYRQNPIEPPEPEDQNGNPREDGKIEAGDIVATSPVLRWLDNFWYHHKWTVIVVAFFISVAIICLFQFVGRPDYDTSIVFGSTYRMNKDERAEFEKLITRICPEDFNDDGEKLVNIVEYQVYSEEEYESARKEYAAVTNEEGETDSFYINRQYNITEYKNFSQYTMTGRPLSIFSAHTSTPSCGMRTVLSPFLMSTPTITSRQGLWRMASAYP
ncbi:MAG: hypothetical protein IJA91_02495 [Clostridia bacterium]|nr:hypothetical protein [Clostridia bacterium]